MRLSFFGALQLNRIADPESAVPGGLLIASLIDLAATKVKVVQDRASARDYLDIHALIQSGIDLEEALSAAYPGTGIYFLRKWGGTID